MRKVELNTGAQMPILGFGTWKISDDEAEEAVLQALRAGYRHIDTARIYSNERGVGQAIKHSGLGRDDLFITTKLWNADHNNVEKNFKGSLQRLGLDYLDLYLMHWPVPEKNESWKSMTNLLAGGSAKAIGVSNFTEKHLEDLRRGSDIVPAVNQVEFSPFLFQKELMDYCQGKGIAFEAYSPLTQGKNLENPVISKIATKYEKSSAQIMLRWAIQHNIIAIPKTVTPSRMKENFNIFDFEISSEDMQQLDDLNQDLRYCWNPEDMA